MSPNLLMVLNLVAAGICIYAFCLSQGTRAYIRYHLQRPFTAWEQVTYAGVGIAAAVAVLDGVAYSIASDFVGPRAPLALLFQAVGLLCLGIGVTALILRRAQAAG